MIEQATAGLANVSVDIFEGLLVEYVEQQSGHAVIRGLRALSDFEYEFQMALMNRKLNENIETLFMMPRASYSLPQLAFGQGDLRLGRGCFPVCHPRGEGSAGGQAWPRGRKLNPPPVWLSDTLAKRADAQPMPCHCS